MDKIRWGIMGTGAIAKKFAEGLKSVPDAALAAVGSRSRESAGAFADKFGAPRRYGAHEDLASAPDVDVVYVATPHSHHREGTLLCLNAGKPVLCEKPFAINAHEAREMVRCARERRLFLMEAMWTRFLPAMVQVREWLREKAIGEVRMLMADFGFRAEYSAKTRLFDPRLGGGSLLDVGVYCVSLSSMVFGAPDRITGIAHIGETGVDDQAAFLLGHSDGQLAVLSSAVRTATPMEAVIIGTNGTIRMDVFWRCQRVTLCLAGKEARTLDLPFQGTGLNCEAAEVCRCLREGRIESDVMPLDESVRIMETMDKIRAQWGLRYPME